MAVRATEGAGCLREMVSTLMIYVYTPETAVDTHGLCF